MNKFKDIEKFCKNKKIFKALNELFNNNSLSYYNDIAPYHYSKRVNVTYHKLHMKCTLWFAKMT